MGPYYREPKRSEGPLPFHLAEAFQRSITADQVVPAAGDVVYYGKATSA